MLDTDGGPEWKGEFHAMLERNGVAHRLKAPADTNALAVVDRKIQQIKTAISGRMMEEGEEDWKKLLPDVVKALNEAPSDALRSVRIQCDRAEQCGKVDERCFAWRGNVWHLAERPQCADRFSVGEAQPHLLW